MRRFVWVAFWLALPCEAAAEETAPSDTPSLPRYELEGIEIRGNRRTTDAVVLGHIRLAPGDVLWVDDPELENLRYRLLATGFFSKIHVSLRRGSTRGKVALVVSVEERNTLVVKNLWMGIAADDRGGAVEPISPYVGVLAAERSLAGTGIELGAGIGLAIDQLSLRLQSSDPAFVGTEWAAGLELYYLDAQDFFGNREVIFESPLLPSRRVTDYAIVAYERAGGSISGGRDLSSATRFDLTYRLERVEATVPTAASHLRGDTREPIHFGILPGVSALSSVGAAFTYDTRDAPFLPTRGARATFGVTAGLPPIGSDYGFVRTEGSVQAWFPLPADHVFSLALFAGGVAGEAPFFETYYVGDFTDLLPDRILGLNPDRRQPPNFFDTSIVEVRYGDYAARLEGEYRIPLYRGRGAVYGIDAFASTGLYGVAAAADFSRPASGYEGIQRVPVDLTYNLGARIDTSVGGVTLAFSNLLGLLPARGGER